jgi:hypothetical protein
MLSMIPKPRHRFSSPESPPHCRGHNPSLQLLTHPASETLSEQGHEFWNGRGIKWDRESFPPTLHRGLDRRSHSGLSYSHHAWVLQWFNSLATLTSLSRIYEDKHWSSDVFAGAVVGYLAARLTLISTPRLSVMPCVVQPGISLLYTF